MYLSPSKESIVFKPNLLPETISTAAVLHSTLKPIKTKALQVLLRVKQAHKSGWGFWDLLVKNCYQQSPCVYEKKSLPSESSLETVRKRWRHECAYPNSKAIAACYSRSSNQKSIIACECGRAVCWRVSSFSSTVLVLSVLHIFRFAPSRIFELAPLRECTPVHKK